MPFNRARSLTVAALITLQGTMAIFRSPLR